MTTFEHPWPDYVVGVQAYITSERSERAKIWTLFVVKMYRNYSALKLYPRMRIFKHPTARLCVGLHITSEQNF